MPRECLVCGRRLSAREQQLCLWCASDLPLTYYWEQPHNTMSDKLNAALERMREDSEKLPYSYAAGLLFYHEENPYKKIPQAVKYGYNIPAGRFFGKMLGEKMASAPHLEDIDCVIPVPLHWWRRWKRGYNQAEVIAGAIAEPLGARLLANALVRRKRTVSQTNLDAEGRIKNVEGVFRVKRLPDSPRHILVVDDTFTTGATLAACIMAVRRCIGPEIPISAATLAVVDA